MTSEEVMHSALSDILSEGDPSTLYDYGDFANLTTGSDYASSLLEQLSARGFTFVGPTEEGQSTPPLDVTRLTEALISIRRKSDPGVSLAGYRPPTDERGERLNAIFLIADAALGDPA